MSNVSHETLYIIYFKNVEKYLLKELIDQKITYKSLIPQILEVSKKDLKLHENFNHDYIQKYSELIGTLPFVWAHNICFESQWVQFNSISEAQKKLKSLTHGFWYHHPYRYYRRGELISEKLKKFPTQSFYWPSDFLPKTLSLFSLVEPHLLLALINIYPKTPPIVIPFKENKNPPSRAYLKLYEVFYRLKKYPQPNEKILELGSSPGGWTWVLANELKCHVTCVDQGEMNQNILKNKNVTWIKKDAFTFCNNVKWREWNWLFSDMACSPQKLINIIQNALIHNPKLHIIATLKFTDKTQNTLEIYKQFKNISNSYLFHLSHNKHELTWIRI